MATPSRPTGLKLYRSLLDGEQIAGIIARADQLPMSRESPRLFTYYGDYGSLDTEAAQPWMEEWGTYLRERGIFARQPNQYRVCHWRGELSAQFKWHIDNKRHGDEILAISLTDRRSIGFRPKAKKQAVYELQVNAGDGYLIRGTCRWQWEHRVMPVGHTRDGGRSFVVAYRRSAD